MEAREAENVRTTVKGTTLILEIDLGETIGPSSSGKTLMIGTTRGNQRIKAPVPGGFAFVSVNVFRYPDRNGE